jgi:hypothetical protein
MDVNIAHKYKYILPVYSAVVSYDSELVFSHKLLTVPYMK